VVEAPDDGEDEDQGEEDDVEDGEGPDDGCEGGVEGEEGDGEDPLLNRVSRSLTLVASFADEEDGGEGERVSGCCFGWFVIIQR